MRPTGTISVTVLFALVAGCAGLPAESPSLTPAATPAESPSTPLGTPFSSPATAPPGTPVAPPNPSPSVTPGDSPTNPPTASPTAPSPTPPATATPATGWQRLHIADDQPGGHSMMPMIDLALDGAGNAHVAAGIDGAGIVYLTNRGGRWAREQVTKAPGRGFDSQPSLAFDDDGTLHLAFTRWTRYEPCPFGCPGGPRIVLDGIYHASLSGDTWTADRALLPDFHSPSLAVRGGVLHIAAAADTTADQSSVAYARGSSAADLTLSAVSAAGSSPALVLAANGVVHIAFLGGLGGSSEVSVASTATDGTFSIEGVATEEWVYLPPALAEAPNGRLNLAWSNDSSIQLSVHGTAGWGAPWTVTSRGAELGGMAIGPGGDVHVVTLPQFFSAPGLARGVWHYTDRTGQFEGERLGRGPDAETEGARFPSAIAVDAAGRPHIVYTWIGEPSGLYYAIGP